MDNQRLIFRILSYYNCRNINYINKKIMKTPLQEILQFEYYSRQMFDSDEKVAMALLDYIRVNKEDLLEYEQRIFNTKEE